MQTLRAHVRNGRLIMDEPTDIPEGSEIELLSPTMRTTSTRKNESVCIALWESPGRARREVTHALCKKSCASSRANECRWGLTGDFGYEVRASERSETVLALRKELRNIMLLIMCGNQPTQKRCASTGSRESTT
jgi:hypothetical protein